MKKILLFALALYSSYTHAQIISTIAGIGTQSFSGDSGLAINAGLDGPYDVAIDGLGNFYITDGYNNRIRKVDTAGIITTIAGNDTAGYNGDDIAATDAQLYRPAGIICDQSGNIYFADALNNRVRMINTAGIITTIAGNGIGGYNGDNISATSAEINDPHSVSLDTYGNLYITDWNNHRIRKVNTSGIITSIAGTGTAGYTGDNGLADTAEINAPYGIVLDNTGNIYFADAYEAIVRKINISGIITTFAGGGSGATIGDNGHADSARLDNPAGIAIDNNGNLYIADVYNERIRKVNAATGIITTIAGDGTNSYNGDNGPATLAAISDPTGIAIDNSGTLYIADFGNNRIRYVTSIEQVKQVNNITERLSIYPNPSSGIFNIDITSNSNEQVQIIITNSLGDRVKNVTISTNQLSTIQLNQSSGIYYLSVITSQGLASKIINVVK